MRTHSRSGSYSSRAAAADLLLRATMAEPGTLNLNNEVSTEVWKRVGLIFRGLRTAFLRLLEGSGTRREVRLMAQTDFPELRTDSRNSPPLLFHLLVSRWLKCLWLSVVLNFFPWTLGRSFNLFSNRL